MKKHPSLTVATALIILFSQVVSSCQREPQVPSGDPSEEPAQVYDGDETDLVPFTAKNLPVNREGKNEGTVEIRFYEDLPNVPYISAATFQSLILPGSKMTVTKKGPGLYDLKNQGATASVNTIDEEFTCAAYMDFTNLMELVQPGMDNAYYDGAPFLRYASQDVWGGGPVSFRFQSYGIDIRATEDAVYFPFCTLADMYSDLYNHYAACNGEKVVVVDSDTRESGGISDYEPDFSNSSILTKSRPKDLADYSYGEICFVIDNLYGMPGRALYEAGIIQDGIDKTLLSSPEGSLLRQLLRSTDMKDFAAGLDFLTPYMRDGHTLYGNLSVIMDDSFSYMNDYPVLADKVKQFALSTMTVIQVSDALREARNEVFKFDHSDAFYHKSDDTAICHFDSFSGTDMVAWKKYYRGEGPMPTPETSPDDPMAIFLFAIQKADEDPSVKNFVIDISVNGGGSLDLVEAIMSLVTGKAYNSIDNVLTGERVTWHYDVDRNFDGKFDASDDEVKYDLNFCLLISSYSFSCGNILPSLFKDAGLMVVGEKSGGGSCAVAAYRTPEGFAYKISSARARVVDKDGNNIDSGITPDVEIAGGPEMYDLSKLSGLIGEFYK